MMKAPKNRMMQPQTIKAPKSLVCKSECVVHGWGTIARGAVVNEQTHPGLIAFLTVHGDHPNFESKED